GPGGRTRTSGGLSPASEAFGGGISLKGMATSYHGDQRACDGSWRTGGAGESRSPRSANAVATAALGFEQTLVGAPDEIGRALVRFFQGGYPHADGHPDLVGLKDE